MNPETLPPVVKLVRQTILSFREGTSDKVYEVDLCEVKDGFVVNFRYGRRGTELRDGSKTPLPVALEKAEKIFDDLVRSKTKKGYAPDGPNTAAAEATPAVSAEEADALRIAVSDPRHGAVLSRLLGLPARRDPEQGPTHTSGANSKIFYIFSRKKEPGAPGPRVWALPRAIWRAGELEIPEALGILPGLSSGAALQDYCIAFALGRCGRAAREQDEPAFRAELAAAAKFLEQLRKRKQTPDRVRRVAREALRLLYDGDGRELFLSETVRESLESCKDVPPDLADWLIAAASGETDRDAAAAFSAERAALLDAYLDAADHEQGPLLETLYLLDHPQLRPQLLALLLRLPLKPPHFRGLRHVYKMAELRRDGPVFGEIAHRFEMTRANYRVPEYWDPEDDWAPHVSVDGDYIKFSTRARQAAGTRFAYSNRTRRFLRGRTWRSLRRLGRDGRAEYTTMAAGVLAAVQDEDGGSYRAESRYSFDNETHQVLHTVQHHPEHAGLFALNHIMYGAGDRLFPSRSLSWKGTDRYDPERPYGTKREEPFAELWDRSPAVLVDLLLRARARSVHEFAVRILAEERQGAFYERIALSDLVALFRADHECTAALALRIARARFQTNTPDLELALAAALARSETARVTGREWLDGLRDELVASPAALARLIMSVHDDTRNYVRQVLAVADLPDRIAGEVLARVIAELLKLTTGETAVIIAVGQLLLATFGKQLRALPHVVLGDLLKSKPRANQEFAADVLRDHDQIPPSELIETLLFSRHETVRARGVALLGRLDDEALNERRELLLRLMRGKEFETRTAAAPLLKRLAARSPRAAVDILSGLFGLLRGRGSEEALAHVARLLREEFGEEAFARLERADRAAWSATLLKAKASAAREVGGLLLSGLDPEDFSVAETVRLANHEILSVRRAARNFFERSRERVKAELADGVRMLESDWEDTRAFAFDYFRAFDDEAFTPEALVTVCDSVRPLVQQFGREMVTRLFREEHGELYLLRLSEHPSRSMQLFVTNYLADYAADRPDRLKKLVPYFVSVLSMVNRGRLARDRSLAFLEDEALKNRAAAEIVARILTRLSATVAVEERGRCVASMLKLRAAYPDLPLPIRRMQPPLHPRYADRATSGFAQRTAGEQRTAGGQA